MIDKYIVKEYPILKVNLTMMLNKYVGWIECFFEGYVQIESSKIENEHMVSFIKLFFHCLITMYNNFKNLISIF